MIIGIDGNEANVQKKVGVSWYVSNLLHEFAKKASPEIQYKVFLRDVPYKDTLPPENDNFHYVVVPGKRIWSQVVLPINLWLHHRDLSVFIAPAHYAPRACPCPTIVVVHDISYRYYPHDFKKRDLYQLNHWTGYSVKKATHVVAVSECTKHDVILEYALPEKKVSVIYNGFSATDIVPQHTAPRSLNFLFIGTLQPRKNLETVLHALCNPALADATLTIVGKKGWLYEPILKHITSLKLENRVVIKEYVSETEKYALLARSTALLVPGYYEGFGLPLLEAFAVGTPVIAAHSGSLPEIGGSGCVYVSPFAVHEWVQAMKDVKYMKEAKKRLTLFSWEKTASELLALCRTIFERKKQ